MSEYHTSIRFESDGIHLWIKIGEHCRARLSPPAESELYVWLNQRNDVELFGPTSHGMPAPAITLSASRVSA